MIYKKSLLLLLSLTCCALLIAKPSPQTLTQVCFAANRDLHKLQTSTELYLTNYQNLAYKNSINKIYKKWYKKSLKDPCSQKGCDLNTEQEKISFLMNNMSGLTAKLLLHAKAYDSESINQLAETYNSALGIIEKNLTRVC